MREEVYSQVPGASTLQDGVESNGGVGAAPRRQRPRLREKKIVFQGKRWHDSSPPGHNGNLG